MKTSSILTSGIFIIGLILAGKVLALAKDVVITAYFGTGPDIDAYFMAMNTSTVLFLAFWSTILIVFLPLYSEALVQRGERLASAYSSSVLNIFILVSLFLAVTIYLLAPQILNLIDLSSEPERRELAINCLRIMTFSFLFSTITSFMTSMQLTHNQYFYVHIAPIFSNTLVIIAAIVFAQYYGVYSIVIAGVLAWVLQLPIHFAAVRKYFTYSLKLNLKREEWSRLGLLLAPAFLGVLVDQMNLLLNTVLVTSLDVGSIAALNYANKLVTLVSGTSVVAIMTIMFPLLSKHAAEENTTALNASIRASTRLVILIMIPATLVTLFFNREIVTIVFQRGLFDAEATQLTSSILFYFAIGLLFLGLREVFNKAFYALKTTTTPLYISLLSLTLNIPLSIWLVREMGAQGLALATSLAMLFYVIVQIICLRRQIGAEYYRGLGTLMMKLLCIGAVMAITMHLFKSHVIPLHPFLNLTIGAGIAIIIYLAGLLVLNVEEARTLTSNLYKYKRE